ncbi:hypothetical protein CTM45_11520 [Prevotella intermedia]|nr:hypothetical protein CTM45_11520 [Prevotella intermedia]
MLLNKLTQHIDIKKLNQVIVALYLLLISLLLFCVIVSFIVGDTGSFVGSMVGLIVVSTMFKEFTKRAL